MSTSPAFFCDICGAALTPEAMSCYACGQDIDLSLSPLFEQTTATPEPLARDTSSGPIHIDLDQLTPGYVLAGRYTIVCQIGSGGFGKVYQAKDRTQRNTLVAIKQFNLHALSSKEIIEATDSYNREVMHLSKLRHENLPRMHEHFTDPGHWYVVLDYIEGETLEDVLKKRRGGRLSLQRALDIGVALCNVLEYLHSQRPAIIFRDVKPANVMITRTGHVYLIDFGIARRYTPGQARDTGQLGSPGFAAPEQYGRAQTNEQTDIYGLGATLQTLLTGKDPLELLTAPKAHRHVSKKLKPLLLQMLERDPAKRPKNMAQVRNFLLYIRDAPRAARVRKVVSGISKVGKNLLPLVLLTLLIRGLSEGPFFLLYLIIMSICTVGYLAMSLYSETQENQAKLPVKDACIFLLKRTALLTRFALCVSLFFLALSVSIDGPYWSAYLFLAECFAIMTAMFGCYYLFTQVRHIQAMARIRRQKARNSLFQQQMHRF